MGQRGSQRIADPEVTAMPHQRFVQSGADFRLTFDCAPDRIEAFRSWMDAAAVPSSEMRFRPPTEIGSLAAILHHFGSLWQRRHLPNVAMFHFADYQADLVGELIRLAEVLGIELGCARARELAAYATLDAMRERAFDFAPNATDGVWRSNERFFRAGVGVSGGRSFVGPSNSDTRSVSPHWLRRIWPPGRTAVGTPATLLSGRQGGRSGPAWLSRSRAPRPNSYRDIPGCPRCARSGPWHGAAHGRRARRARRAAPARSPRCWSGGR